MPLRYMANPSFVDCATSAYLWYQWAANYLALLAPVTILSLLFTGRRTRWLVARRLSIFYTCYCSLGFANRWINYQFSGFGWVPGYYMPFWLVAGLIVIWALCWIWPWRFGKF